MTISSTKSQFAELSEATRVLEQLKINYCWPHLFEEEHILFPYVANLQAIRECVPSNSSFEIASNPLRAKMWEHDTAEDLLLISARSQLKLQHAG